MSLADVAGWLACPVCRRGMRLDERRLACAAGHSFDVAKQGYVNLLGTASPVNADTSAMVGARSRFLGGGHYRPIADAVARRMGASRRVLEVGAGTGYYLSAALEACVEASGLATDVSPAACRVAARAHPRIGAVVADTWAGLPVRSSAVDAVLCVFAPRNADEFARVLAPGGRLIVVTPDEAHLAALRSRHGLLDVRPDKAKELGRTLVGFEPIATQHVRYDMPLTAAAVADLVAMGPNAFHTADLAVDATAVEVSVHVSVFRKPLG